MAGLLTADEIAWITPIVVASLDQSLPLYHVTTALDGAGHTTETYPGTPSLMLACTIGKPTATQLGTYADIIAGQRALMLRYMPTSDVREGDRLVYMGLNWKVQPLANAESYTVANDVLITTIT